jgi:hypothetical protein
MAQTQSDLPIYSKVWNSLKGFPAILSKGSDNAPATNGPAAAALISGGVGAMTMMIVHHFCDTNAGFDPMWGNIGSYAGKETTLLLGWLISWPILYFLLKDKQLRPRTIFFWLLGLYTVAASMAYHPLYPYMPLT